MPTNNAPTNNQPCRCDSGLAYHVCCGPLHRGERPAATAVTLMRSRFTAFALGDVAYLLATWHPSTRPADLDLDEDIEWLRLQIVDTEDGGEHDRTGVVQFRAQYRRRDDPAGRRHLLHERSRFTRDRAGRWLYVDGDFLD